MESQDADVSKSIYEAETENMDQVQYKLHSSNHWQITTRSFLSVLFAISRLCRTCSWCCPACWKTEAWTESLPHGCWITVLLLSTTSTSSFWKIYKALSSNSEWSSAHWTMSVMYKFHIPLSMTIFHLRYLKEMWQELWSALVVIRCAATQPWCFFLWLKE